MSNFISSYPGLIGYYEGNLKGLKHMLESFADTNTPMSIESIERVMKEIDSILSEGNQHWERIRE